MSPLLQLCIQIHDLLIAKCGNNPQKLDRADHALLRAVESFKERQSNTAW